ncbi:hypothetical protein CCAN11_370002 [Capnocytophaga canimorsus]|uniref:Uncharacterized protein n=1 Tax=Capnocytophaga canimorsus TaxID=28188 RepID=A0A0B7ISD5_9FLAO|nr:hypothetical protein CCAN11_370002 [Capnocytophaga canimorsus]
MLIEGDEYLSSPIDFNNYQDRLFPKPSLYTPNTLTLRTAINSNENAFGISYILDDMPLSNDENMQTYNGSTPATSFFKCEHRN